MAKYEITAPDGSRYEIDAPQDATEQQALDYFKSQYTSGLGLEKPSQFKAGAKAAAESVVPTLGGLGGLS